jgi:hypothetical protein
MLLGPVPLDLRRRDLRFERAIVSTPVGHRYTMNLASYAKYALTRLKMITNKQLRLL